MQHNPQKVFLSYAKIQWGIAFFVFCMEVIWIHYASFSFHFSKKEVLQTSLSLIFLFLIYLFYKKFRYDFKITFLLESTFFLCVYAGLMLVLSYLVATLQQPFIDSILAAADEYLGIYSPSLVFWFRSHLWWNIIFTLIYNSYIIQFPLLIIYFCFRGENIVLQRFLMLFVIATPLTIILSGFFPGAGPYVWYHYPPDVVLGNALNHLYELRNNIVDISKRDGIIIFPSFHVILALLYTYACRNERKSFFFFMVGLNSLVIFSCLPIGQHYFADILGGFIVFFITAFIERSLFSFYTSRH